MRSVTLLLVAAAFAGVLAETSYYDVLGVDEDASAQNIKRAFRKLSLKYHPDKCREDGCHEHFVEVNHAYEVLSDDDKRRRYDQFGEEGLKDDHAQQQGGMNPFDMFFGGGGRQQQDGPPRGPDTVVPLRVSLKDLYEGREVPFRQHKRKVCPKCRGTGAFSKKHMSKCPVCGGRGARIVRQQLAPGFVQQVQMECDHCSGKGRIITRKCTVCSGDKVVSGTEEMTVFIEKGMKDGAEITYEHAGDEQADKRPGHLVFRVKTVEKGDFRRSGDDLHLAFTISLLESLVGFSRTISHLDGHDVVVRRSAVTKPGLSMRIRGEGMPHQSDPSTFGDLIVTFTVAFPEVLTAAQADVVARVLA